MPASFSSRLVSILGLQARPYYLRLSSVQRARDPNLRWWAALIISVKVLLSARTYFIVVTGHEIFFRGFMILFSMGLAGPLMLYAGPKNYENLLNKSPFGELASLAATDSNAVAPLEFRGVVVEDGVILFSLHEVPGGSHWVTLNDEESPYIVKDYDSDAQQIAVQYQGKILSLRLKVAKIVTIAPVAAAARPSQVIPNTRLGPNPTEDARRQVAVAEEIRRRRVERHLATLAANPSITRRD